MRWKKSWSALWLAFSLIFGLASVECRRAPADEETIIDILKTLGRLAEEEDIEAMIAYFADDFTDFQGRSKGELQSLLSGYLDQRIAVVVHFLGIQIVRLEGSEAAAETEVAVSSGRAEALRRLVKIAPDLYRIEVRFVRQDGRWLIQYAAWTAVELSNLLPESLAILKKLFPGT